MHLYYKDIIIIIILRFTIDTSSSRFKYNVIILSCLSYRPRIVRLLSRTILKSCQYLTRGGGYDKGEKRITAVRRVHNKSEFVKNVTTIDQCYFHSALLEWTSNKCEIFKKLRYHVFLSNDDKYRVFFHQGNFKTHLKTRIIAPRFESFFVENG